MANSKLKNKIFKIPNNVISYIHKLKSVYKDKETKRLDFLLDKGVVSYYEMKRLKNFFDNFSGKNTDVEFLLNGGVPIRNWVNSTLKNERNKIKTAKETLTNSGLSNQYKKEYYQDNTKIHNINGRKIKITESQLKKLISKYLF